MFQDDVFIEDQTSSDDRDASETSAISTRLVLECKSVRSLVALKNSRLANVTRLQIVCDKFEDDDNGDNETEALLQMPKLEEIRIRKCGMKAVRLAATRIEHGALSRVELPENDIKRFEWTLARKFNTQRLDLRCVRTRA